MTTEIDIETYKALVTHNFPQIAIRTVQPVTRGWDSFVLEINGELIFRFPMRDDAMGYLRKEIALLPLLEPALSTPIPHFSMIGQGFGNYPYTFVGYRKLDGLTLEDEHITSEQLASLAPALGNFLSELHRFPVELAVQSGMQDQTAAQWREVYQGRYEALQQRVFPHLDATLQAKTRQVWERFLDNLSLFAAFQPGLIHCDLAPEHIFSDPQRGLLTGVIDWGDATIGDPTIDFVGLHIRGGRAFTERVLAHYSGTVDEAFWQRMDFYTRYGPFSKLLYGSHGYEQIFSSGIEELRVLPVV